MKFTLILAVLFSAVLISCDKDDDAPAVTRTQMISSSSWKYDTAGIDVSKDGSIDTEIPSIYFPDCVKDNSITFRADGTGTIDEGSSKCDPDDEQTSNFTWTFKNSETIINFPEVVFEQLSGDVVVKSLSATQLVLIKKDFNLGIPTTVDIIVQLKH